MVRNDVSYRFSSVRPHVALRQAMIMCERVRARAASTLDLTGARVSHVEGKVQVRNAGGTLALRLPMGEWIDVVGKVYGPADSEALDYFVAKVDL